MSRSARVVFPFFPHHVTLRGNNRRSLFSQAPDYRYFLFLLGLALKQSNVRVYALTLMTNHVHLVVCPPDAVALSKFVKRLAQRYAQYRNAKRNGSGRLFESRFFSCPILTDEQLAVTLAYVELNPVRGGLVDNVGDYRWSTYRCHTGDGIGVVPPALWTPSPWFLALASSDSLRAQRYAHWVADCRARDVRPEVVGTTETQAALHQMTVLTSVRRPDGSRAA